MNFGSGNRNNGASNSIPKNNSKNTILKTTTLETVTKPKERQKLFIRPVRHVVKQTIPQKKLLRRR